MPIGKERERERNRKSKKNQKRKKRKRKPFIDINKVTKNEVRIEIRMPTPPF